MPLPVVLVSTANFVVPGPALVGTGHYARLDPAQVGYRGDGRLTKHEKIHGETVGGAVADVVESCSGVVSGLFNEP